jgi:hypothetical protein
MQSLLAVPLTRTIGMVSRPASGGMDVVIWIMERYPFGVCE